MPLGLIWAGLLLSAAAAAAPPATHFSPVVGILAAPEFKPAPGQPKRSYVPSSYVKWLEAQGARVVPLIHDAPAAETASLLERLNGLVFPGGAFPMEPAYLAFSRRVFETAVRDAIPTWGACLGLLQFLLYTSGKPSPGPVTDGWDALGGPKPLLLPVNLTDAGKQWYAASGAEPRLLKGVTEEPWAWHSHAFAVAEEEFQASPQLRRFWNVLAVARDRRGRAFVDAVEAKRLPIAGAMFHPEKWAYEFLPERSRERSDLARPTSSIEAMANFGRCFVRKCRAFRGQRFTAEEVTRLSIHNWPEQFTAPGGSLFESQYFFPAASRPGAPPILGAPTPLARFGSAA